MTELNFKDAYLHLVGRIDDIICKIEIGGAHTDAFFIMEQLKTALSEAEDRAIGE